MRPEIFAELRKPEVQAILRRAEVSFSQLGDGAVVEERAIAAALSDLQPFPATLRHHLRRLYMDGLPRGRRPHVNDVEKEREADRCPWTEENLAKLRPGDREILRLRYWCDAMPRQIAAEMGIGVEAARSRLRRARDRFRLLV